MKFMTFTKNAFSKALLCLALSGFAVTSCFDDSSLWESIKDIEQKMEYLQNQLDAELKALKAIVNGQVTIKTCVANEDGTYMVTLSDGTSFTVYPKQEMLKSVVTYSTIGGVDYWAYYDEQGVKHTLLDEDNELIPVKGSDPEIITRDDKHYLVIGGVEYPLAGNSIFSGYEVNKDELSGEVQSVTFTFGEDMSFTITVDGVCSLTFVEGNFMMGYTKISQQYVAPGTKGIVYIQKVGVVDYVLQAPNGWKVTETEDENLGIVILDITAPAKEAVEAGLADAEGYLKAISVYEGGKAGASRLFLTASPFEEFSVVGGVLTVKPMPGVEKFAYGVCDLVDYDEENIVSVVNPLFAEYDYPKGYGISSSAIELPLVEIYGEEIEPGDPLVIWAAPAIYDEGDETTDAYYYITVDAIESMNQGYSSYTFEVSDPTYKDATLNMELKGISKYYTGVAPVSESFATDLIVKINGGYYEPVTEPYTYNGSVFDYANDSELVMSPNTSYYVWLLIAEEEKVYEESDLILVEFTTTGITSGGTIEVKKTDTTVTPTNITLGVEAEGAGMIYYAWVSAANIGKYSTDEQKAAYLLSDGHSVVGDNITAESDITLKPNTDVYFMAMAVDADGKYGPVYHVMLTTSEIPFNTDLKVSLELVENNAGNFRVGLSSTGAEDVSYIYWVGKASATFWISKSSGLGATASNAEVYMYVNPDDSRFTTCMANYPLVDGIVLMEDLSLATDYVFVAVAVDSEGKYSHAEVLKFTTRSMNLGDIVYAQNSDGSDNLIWTNARPTVEFLQSTFHAGEGMRSGSYSFNVTIPTGYTGYVLSGTEYYYAEGKGISTISKEAAIIQTVEYADDRKDIDILVDDELWSTLGYPSGWIIYCYMHGAPIRGAAVIFADKATHDAECDCEDTYVYSRKDTHPESDGGVVVLINDGNPVTFTQPDAVYNPSTTESHDLDKVFITLKDKDGNFFETYIFDVPDEYFAGTSAE